MCPKKNLIFVFLFLFGFKTLQAGPGGSQDSQKEWQKEIQHTLLSIKNHLQNIEKYLKKKESVSCKKDTKKEALKK